jgi:hypothetical protein
MLDPKFPPSKKFPNGKSVYHFAITHIIAFDPTMGQSIEPDQTYKTVINSFVWDPFWVLTLTKV